MAIELPENATNRIAELADRLKVAERSAEFLGKSGEIALHRRVLRPQSYYQAALALRDRPRVKQIHTRLEEYTERNGSFFFVQVGAHDGSSGSDPVSRHVAQSGWKGLLVEPVPHIFKQLQANYQGKDGLSFANVAIADQEGEATMYAAVELPEGQTNPLSQVSSLKPGIAEKFNWMVEGTWSQYVEPVQVRTTTLPTLLENEGIKDIDGLFIDAEGYDKVVLDQLDLDQIAPRFVMYEHNHLPMHDRRELTDRFAGHGYEVTELRRDTFAALQ